MLSRPTTSSTAPCRCSTATRWCRTSSRARCGCDGRAAATILGVGVPRRRPASRSTLLQHRRPRALVRPRARQPPDDRDHVRFVLGPSRRRRRWPAFHQRFGCHVVEGYGSSEGAMIIQPIPGMPPGALGPPRRGQSTSSSSIPTPARNAHGRVSMPTAGCSTPATPSARSCAATRPAASRATTTTPRPTPSVPGNGWYWSGDLGLPRRRRHLLLRGPHSDWLRVDGENFAASAGRADHRTLPRRRGRRRVRRARPRSRATR